jgi:6-phosphogluconolactonase
LTFTYPLINAARSVAFLVNDSKKESIVQKVLEGGHGFPAEDVKPVNGELVWFIGQSRAGH